MQFYCKVTFIFSEDANKVKEFGLTRLIALFCFKLELFVKCLIFYDQNFDTCHKFLTWLESSKHLNSKE